MTKKRGPFVHISDDHHRSTPAFVTQRLFSDTCIPALLQSTSLKMDPSQVTKAVEALLDYKDKKAAKNSKVHTLLLLERV